MHKLICIICILIFNISARSEDADGAVVFLHGIYEDTTLFTETAEYFKKQGIDFTNTHLPGHGEDSPQSYSLGFERWLKHVNKIADSITTRGNKIIFVTHSLGSLLALQYTLKNQQDVAALVLVEPALEPRDIIKNASCLAKNILKDARYFLPLARIFFNIPAKDRPIAVNMACELTKVMPTILRENNFNNIQELANNINVPVLLINNVDDLAVKPQVNKIFFNSLKSKSSSIYHEFENTPHGAIFLRNPELILDLLKSFLSSSLRAAYTKPN